ncbi:DUF2950 domain-containing protein [Peristeroidobacter soli]|uniref:DUF2950 domain-containing protein n=1 Tax=Peristeroidobacter soli TaxID=2497877 RepID=UPI00101BF7BE|nr:DUF2950 domain-containing protein [Peristeroidobacter soli]
MKQQISSTLRIFMLLLMMAAAACNRGTQRDFASIDDAVGALVAAARSDDTRALVKVLGAEAEPAISSGDPIQDRNARERFVRAYETEHTLSRGAAGEATLLVGTDQWPFPFPLVQSNGRWHFDSDAGTDEIVNRRVGANELATIQSCLAFVDAQREYYMRNPQGAALLQFSQRLVSSKGQKDGLYWPTTGNEPPSPLGEGFARAQGEGYFQNGPSKNEPLRGYIYRLLTAQGPNARGGAYSYLVDGKMIGGFALITIPAEYGRSGVMTFIVNHDGVVYSKDLGPDTPTAARAIQTFDPDSSWQPEVATGQPMAAQIAPAVVQFLGEAGFDHERDILMGILR